MWSAEDMAELIDPDLPNYAEAELGDGSMLPGYFSASPGEVFGVVTGTGPVFLCPPQGAPERGETLCIDGVDYTVATIEKSRPGFLVLRLESA